MLSIAPLSSFAKLWVGQSLAQLASQMSFLAIPLVAAVTLSATPMQMGFLTAAGSVPSLVFGLQAGSVVDRFPKRPIMIGSDLLRAGVLALVPLAWWLDLLSIPLLCLLVALAACGSMMFDVAYQAMLPRVVARRRLVDANSKMELSRTAAELAGPGIGGVLLQVVGAPLTLLANCGLHGISAIVLWSMNVAEPRWGENGGPKTSIRAEISEGLRTVWHLPLVRTVIGARGLLTFFDAMLEAVFVLYIVTVLGLGPITIGIAFGIGGLGFLVGTLLPSRLNRRLGTGTATMLAAVTIAMSDALVPLAEGTGFLIVPLLIVAQFFFGIGMTVFNVNGVSVRQLLVSQELQGRASAIGRFVALGVVPAGALLGGLLGGVFGLRETLFLAAAGEALVAVWLWRSPLRGMPDFGDDDGTSETVGNEAR